MAFIFRYSLLDFNYLFGCLIFAGRQMIKSRVIRISTKLYPVAYEKTWDDGKMTPGIWLLTLFNRKKGLDYETFIHRWHNSHTPLSLKIHPLWNYSRNVVEKILAENSTSYEGIVEEQMRTDRDLLNPFRFFGNPMVIIPRMIAVYKDTQSFLDYGGIETYMAREVVVK